MTELFENKPQITKVSVIIPTYNYGQYLAESIDSALNQTHHNVEVIVIDDGSTDQTQQVAKRYGERIRYVHQTNQGLSAARNAGIKLAAGEYIACLDADDTLEPEFVTACLAVLGHFPEAAYVYPQMRWFGRVNLTTHYPDYDLKRLVRGNYIHATALFRAEILHQFHYDQSMKEGWEDYDLYLSLAERGHRGKLLNRPLLNYRKHDSMVDQISPAKQKTLHHQIMNRHPKLYPPWTKTKVNIVYFVRSKPWLANLAHRFKRLIKPEASLYEFK